MKSTVVDESLSYYKTNVLFQRILQDFKSLFYSFPPEQTPAEEKPEWLKKAEQRIPLNLEQIEAVTAPITHRRPDDEEGGK